jgi:predicted AlkP superfamily pyrophosphatase or phosphodiesterase
MPMRADRAETVGFARCARARLVPLLACLLALAGPAQAAPPPDRPRLLVFLVVDQMRADYPEWYGARWKGGLRRLFDKGAWLRAARFPYLNTMTCPGHFTISTGAYPQRHGMILNTWYDRARGKVIDCTDDPAAPLLAYAAAPPPHRGDSARNLVIPTVADEMTAQLPLKPQVASFSMKARSALGLAGHGAGVVVWFDGSRWVTSSAFAPAPTPWVRRFVEANPIAVDRPWTRLNPLAAYRNDDDDPAEKPGAGWTRTFPHPLAGAGLTGAPLARWAVSPAADEYLARFAGAALVEMKLGQGPSTDILAISFSATDVIGHQFGPLSHEVQDVLARLDLVVGGLLDLLDQKVGPENYLLVLTADHGVAPIPEQTPDGGRLQPGELKERANEAIATALAAPGPHLVEALGNDLYLAPGVHDRLAAKPGAIDKVLAALRAIPGVAEAYDGAALAAARPPAGEARGAAALSYYPGRSGDFLLVPKRHWIVGSLGSNHGSVQDYDQRVPIVFFGKHIKAGKYDRPATPADIAPTIAHLLGVRLPQAQGAVLADVIAPAAPPRRARARRP